MININPLDEYVNLSPPNSIHEFLQHPSGSKILLEIAIFNHHRFAFYYWNLWKKKFSKDNKLQIDLISYDWHQDLLYPQKDDKKELKLLNRDNDFEISYYSSYRLSSMNDSHIMSAIYLDLINDAWILCKQGTFACDWEDEYIKDYNGKSHTIRKFKKESDLQKALFNSNVQNVFFDIDLDYFTINNNKEDDKKFEYMKDSEIKILLSSENHIIKWIFNRLLGITIALEPQYTGGIRKSLKYLSLIEKLWFNKPLYDIDNQWNHLTKYNF